MARKLAKSFKAQFPSHRDEFDSAAMLGLVEAAQAWDPARNVVFSTFARQRVLGSLLDVQRRMIPRGFAADPEHAPVVTSLSSGPVAFVLEHEDTRWRLLRLRNWRIDEKQPPPDKSLSDREDLDAWLRQLPARHASILHALCVEGLTQQETARRLGLCQSRVCVLRREALSLLDGSWYRDQQEDDGARLETL